MPIYIDIIHRVVLRHSSVSKQLLDERRDKAHPDTWQLAHCWHIDYSMSKRERQMTLTHRADCSTCGREVAVNQDGYLRRHSNKGVRCPLTAAKLCLTMWAPPQMVSTFEDRQRCREIVAAADLRRVAELEEKVLADRLIREPSLNKEPDDLYAPATRWERWQRVRQNLSFVAFLAVLVAFCSHCAH